MKKLKTVLLLIMVFSLLTGGMPGYAATEEIEAEIADSYELMVLKGLGYINDSFEETSEELTRAEAISGIMSIIGFDIADGKVVFDDVLPEHKYYKKIYEGYMSGYVNGVGGRHFRPEDPIRFQDIKKLVIDILGYQSHAEYQGYDVMAVKLGIFSGIETSKAGNLTKAGYVELIYNMIHAPYAEITSISSTGNATYEVDKEKMFINKFNIYGSRGIFEAVDYYSIDGITCKGGYVRIAGETFKSNTDTEKIKVGTNVEYYYSERKNADPVLLFVAEYGNTIEAVSIEDIQELSIFEISYKDREKNKVYKRKIDTLVDVLVNFTSAEFNPTEIKSMNGIIYLIDNNGDNTIDCISVEASDTYFVSYVDAGSKMIYDKRGKAALDLRDYQNITVISNGKTVDLSEIPPRCVLSVYLTKGTDSKVATIKVSNARFAGKISKIKKNEEYTIYDNTYKLANDYNSNRDLGYKFTPQIKMGMTAMFYFDINNRIVAVDISGYDPYEYGLVIAAKESKKDDFDKISLMKIFSASGQMKVYTFKEEVIYNGKKMNAEDAIVAFKTAFSKASAEKKSKVIKFAVDTKGNIKEFFDTYSTDENKKVVFSYQNIKPAWRDANMFTDEWTGNAKDAYGIKPEASMLQTTEEIANSFSASIDEEECKIIGVNTLTKDVLYPGIVEIYDADEARGASFVLLKGKVSKDYREPWSMVVNEVYYEYDVATGESRTAIEGIHGDTEVKYYAKEDELFNGVKPGDIVLPVRNTKGEVELLRVLFTFSDTPLNWDENPGIYKGDFDLDEDGENDVVTTYSGEINTFKTVVHEDKYTLGSPYDYYVAQYGTVKCINDGGFSVAHGSAEEDIMAYYNKYKLFVCEEVDGKPKYRIGSWDELTENAEIFVGSSLLRARVVVLIK